MSSNGYKTGKGLIQVAKSQRLRDPRAAPTVCTGAVAGTVTSPTAVR